MACEKKAQSLNRTARGVFLSAPLTSCNLSAMQRKPSGLRDWLTVLRRHVFAKMTGADSMKGAQFGIVDPPGYVRETNDGRLFEPQTKVAPANLAHTLMGFQAHADKPYRNPQPTVQVLACPDNSATGGENTVVGGFATTQPLRAQISEGFDLLATHCARFSYIGSAGVALHTRRPLIEVSPDGVFRRSVSTRTLWHRWWRSHLTKWRCIMPPIVTPAHSSTTAKWKYTSTCMKNRARGFVPRSFARL